MYAAVFWAARGNQKEAIMQKAPLGSKKLKQVYRESEDLTLKNECKNY